MPPGYDVPYVFVLVRVKPGDCPATIPFIENTWKKYADNETIDYSFLDQDVGRMYDADQETSRIVTMFSILAIFVACLGLLGLALDAAHAVTLGAASTAQPPPAMDTVTAKL